MCYSYKNFTASQQAVLNELASDYICALTDSERLDLYNDFNPYPEDEIYTNDNETLRDKLNGVEPYDILYLAFYGNYRYTDNYFRFDSNGNLESTNNLDDFFDFQSDEFIKFIVENEGFQDSNFDTIERFIFGE